MRLALVGFMTQEFSYKQPALLGSLDALLDSHGLWRLVAALPVVLMQRARRRPSINPEHLDEHLRKDMGLPPPKRERLPNPYEIWR